MPVRRTPTRLASGLLATALQGTGIGVRRDITKRPPHLAVGVSTSGRRSTAPGSNGATPGPSAPGDHIDDDDRDDRADSGDDDRADVQRTIHRLGVEEDARKEAAHEGGDDPA